VVYILPLEVIRNMLKDMKKVLFVGINPSPTPYEKYRKKKLTTRTRFNEWCDYLKLGCVGFVNCISTRGDYTKSMIDYDTLKKSTRGHDKIIALGNFPSDALKKIGIKHFKLPHPSPLNRLLNDPNYTKKTLRKCKRYIEDVNLA
tara:strand:- start:630 stop:1064 length:435 start_codon:yes stop_codon:yes gene_type:complete